MLGGVLGLFFNPISSIMKGIVTRMASNLKKLITFCCISLYLSPSTSLTIKPGRALPVAPDIRLIVTAEKIITGMEAGLNQLVPIMDGELKINIQPIEQSVVPAKHQNID